jgi:signal transduction histidine kinase
MAIVHPDDRFMLAAAFRRTHGDHSNTAMKFRIVRPSGEIRAIFSQADAAYDEAGDPLYISVAMMDITEKELASHRQIELETQLRHSEKLTALGTLAGGIAHDLNNTLVPIQALSKLVMHELEPGAQARKDLELVYQASLQARDLVRQILAFSRKQEIVNEPTDLGAKLREALHILRASLPSTIELVERIANVPPILADATQWQQVVVNLVTNGAHAIGDELGRITVTLDEVAGAENERVVRLSVADSGCGMSPDIIHRMFEPFFTTKAVGEGTGLGLSVVHGIVTSHGGKIDVKSTPGQGSQFVILLPAKGTPVEIAAVA